MTESAGQIPAHISALELPRRTLFFLMTIFFFPTKYKFVGLSSLINKKEKEVSLDMTRDRTPPLFVTVDSFEGNPQQRRNLFLSLA